MTENPYEPPQGSRQTWMIVSILAIGVVFGFCASAYFANMTYEGVFNGQNGLVAQLYALAAMFFALTMAALATSIAYRNLART